MKLLPSLFARVASLVPVLLTTALAAQVPDDDANTAVPLDSLVLVLNLISSTHARPATGVVLAGEVPGGNSLVMVPASFVGAGDEIIVLDGGNDILRNGRPTRTVARSTEAGVALLEVEGMTRPGVALARDAWTWPADVAYEYAAWPAAGALAEGAALIVRTLRTGERPPAISGPLFDRCGYLAAMFIADEDGRFSGSPELAEFLDAFGILVEQNICSGETQSGQVSDLQESESLTKPDSAAGEAGNPGAAAVPPGDEISTLGLTSAQKTGLLIAWLGLGLLAFILYLRLRKRRKPAHVVLERHTEDGKRFQYRLKLDPLGQTAQFVRQGFSLDLQMTSNGLVISTPEDEHRDRPGFVLDGTPCLAGEKFIVEEGQEILLGGETFRLAADSDKPGTHHGKP